MGEELKKSDGEGTEGTSPAWMNVVPEFFFDLISRVPPGTALVSYIVWESSTGLRDLLFPTGEKGQAALYQFPYLASLLGLLCAGWVAGILLSPLGGSFRRFYLTRAWKSAAEEYPDEVRDAAKQLGVPVTADGVEQLVTEVGKWDRSRSKRLYRLMHDRLKERSRTARLLLPKMSAEAALFENGFVVAVGVFVHQLVLLLGEGSMSRGQAVLAVCALSAALAYGAWWRTCRLLFGQLSYWREEFMPKGSS